jgi:hypothetical protein
MVRKIDAEYLEKLRAYAAEVRADLAERQAAAAEDHEAIMAQSREVLKRFDLDLVYKTNNNSSSEPRGSELIRGVSQPPLTDQPFTDDPAPFTDEQIDVIATVIAEMRREFRDIADAATASLRERIASLEGANDMLMTMLADTNKMRLLR